MRKGAASLRGRERQVPSASHAQLRLGERERGRILAAAEGKKRESFPCFSPIPRSAPSWGETTGKTAGSELRP
jgi:hypothetical protein